MFLLKIIRKLGQLLRGGASSREIFLGALLGVLIGMVPGFNLTLLLVIFLLLILNANVGIALPAVVLGKFCCLLLAPVTFQVGYTLIHRIGLEGLFRAIADTPVLALLDLHVYCLIGGLPVAILIGIAFAWAAARMIKSLRIGIVEATARSEKMQKLAANKLVRLLLWLVFGPQKEALADLLQKRGSVFRKSGVILASVVIVLVLVFDLLLLDWLVKLGLEKGLTAANGAEVNVGYVDVSLLGGKLDVREIRMTDPDKPTHNLLQIERLAADLSVRDLLAKRYAVDLLAITGVRRDIERASPGRVATKERPPRPKPKEPQATDESLMQYFEKTKALQQYLYKFQGFLDRQATQAETDKARQREKQKEQLFDSARHRGYLALSAQELLAKHPAWLIRKVLVDGVVLTEGAQPQKLEGTDLSSHPELHTEPMRLQFGPTGAGPRTVVVVFHFEKPGEMHRLQVRLDDLPLGGAGLSDKVPLRIEDGRVDIRADGVFSSDAMKIPFELVLKQLKSETREGRSVLGLDPKTAQKVFASLDEFKIAGTIKGAPYAPRLRLDEKQILASLKDALVKAGRAELTRRIDQQLGRVTAKLTDKIGEELKDKLPGVLPGDLRDLIPGLGTKPEKKDEKKKEKKDEDKRTPADLLKDLF